MDELEEITKILQSITVTLDRMAQNERKFDLDTCIHFERLSHSTYCISNDLQSINKSYGV